jgi:hypothetical protein
MKLAVRLLTNVPSHSGRAAPSSLGGCTVFLNRPSRYNRIQASRLSQPTRERETEPLSSLLL